MGRSGGEGAIDPGGGATYPGMGPGTTAGSETKGIADMEILRRSWLLGTAATAIIAGYVTLDMGRLSVGPLLLVAGYCVLLPLFLWTSFRKRVGE